MLHDVTAISASVYLGEGAGAAVAVIYLWITVGNGFRFGVADLYACAALSLSGFAVVYLSSEYWQRQELLSIYIVLVVLVGPPYVGSLLRSLHGDEFCVLLRDCCVDRGRAIAEEIRSIVRADVAERTGARRSGSLC